MKNLIIRNVSGEEADELVDLIGDQFGLIAEEIEDGDFV